MRRLWSAVLALLVGAVFAAVGAAKPVAGGDHVRLALTDTVPTFFLAGPVDAPSPQFLPTAGCPFAPAREARLTALVEGSEGPVSEPLGVQEVALRATVRGTVTDLAGRGYTLAGAFGQTGVTRWPLSSVPFDGTGHLTISGPHGTVAGDAAFRVVADFPLEWDFTFTKIAVCRLR